MHCSNAISRTALTIKWCHADTVLLYIIYIILYCFQGSRYYVNSTVLKLGAENVLVVRVDCTQPDGWWYDGGGIYRHCSAPLIRTTLSV